MEPDPTLSEMLRLSVLGASLAGSVIAVVLAALILTRRLHVRPMNRQPHALILVSVALSYGVLVKALWQVQGVRANFDSWAFFTSQVLFIIGAVWLARAATRPDP